MPKRSDESEETGTFRERFPKQINGAVSFDTYDRVEALRDTLGKVPTGEVIRRGVDALVKQLSAEDRKYFEMSLARIRKRRQAGE